MLHNVARYSSKETYVLVTLVWCFVQDVSDLFGADLPVEGGKGGQFAWRDGPLLRALKLGDWVVLDEVRALVI